MKKWKVKNKRKHKDAVNVVNNNNTPLVWRKWIIEKLLLLINRFNQYWVDLYNQYIWEFRYNVWDSVSSVLVTWQVPQSKQFSVYKSPATTTRVHQDINLQCFIHSHLSGEWPRFYKTGFLFFIMYTYNQKARGDVNMVLPEGSEWSSLSILCY